MIFLQQFSSFSLAITAVTKREDLLLWADSAILTNDKLRLNLPNPFASVFSIQKQALKIGKGKLTWLNRELWSKVIKLDLSEILKCYFFLNYIKNEFLLLWKIFKLKI